MGHPTSGLEGVLSAVARTAARLCEAKNCLIFLAEEGHLRLAGRHGALRPIRYAGYGLGKATPALRHVPLIVVTSYALSGDEAKALAAGADGYVSKPYSPRALLATVREYLK